MRKRTILEVSLVALGVVGLLTIGFLFKGLPTDQIPGWAVLTQLFFWTMAIIGFALAAKMFFPPR